MRKKEIDDIAIDQVQIEEKHWLGNRYICMQVFLFSYEKKKISTFD